MRRSISGKTGFISEQTSNPKCIILSQTSSLGCFSIRCRLTSKMIFFSSRTALSFAISKSANGNNVVAPPRLYVGEYRITFSCAGTAAIISLIAFLSRFMSRTSFLGWPRQLIFFGLIIATISEIRGYNKRQEWLAKEKINSKGRLSNKEYAIKKSGY